MTDVERDPITMDELTDHEREALIVACELACGVCAQACQ